ncbi:Tissue inhibitor of metalloproteinase [compost metagenome]
MKTLIALLFSINIFACKCDHVSLKSSFESATFVFIGSVFEVHKTPSGFKTLDNYLSKVQIKKIYKGNNYDDFYTDQATLFGSQLRSCDLIFDEKGDYLIFAYYEPDTGFLFSEHCLYTKKLSDISPDEFKTLESLSQNYQQKLKPDSLKNSTNDDFEFVVDDILNQPNRKINRLNNEIKALKEENSNQKLLTIIIGIISFLILSTSIWLIFRNRKLKSE